MMIPKIAAVGSVAATVAAIIFGTLWYLSSQRAARLSAKVDEYRTAMEMYNTLYDKALKNQRKLIDAVESASRERQTALDALERVRRERPKQLAVVVKKESADEKSPAPPETVCEFRLNSDFVRLWNGAAFAYSRETGDSRANP